MLALYGPLVGASALVKALGFKTYAAFHRARRLGNLPISVFDLPGRRGPFARTTDIADWLETLDDEQRPL
jgi:hypothetical protein